MDQALINLLAGVGGALAALAGVAIAWYLGKRSENIALAQRRLDSAAFAAEWFRDLRAWASEAIDVLSEASYWCSVDREGSDERVLYCRHSLSALVDRGRFFLPNVRTAEYGTHKPSAYRGYRHSALDPLVAAERALGGNVGGFQNPREAVIQMKREFVSSIQRILAPDQHNQAIARLIKDLHQARVNDSTLGGLLPDERSIPLGADALLEGDGSGRIPPNPGFNRTDTALSRGPAG